MAVALVSTNTSKFLPLSRRAAIFGAVAAPALALPARAAESSFESAFVEFQRLDAILSAAWDAEIAALDDPAERGLAEAARKAADAAVLTYGATIMAMTAKTLREFAIQAFVARATDDEEGSLMARLADVVGPMRE